MIYIHQQKPSARIPYLSAILPTHTMINLSIGRRRVALPNTYCEPDTVRSAVRKHNPPFVVVNALGERLFSTRRPVFLACDDVRVECEGDAEIGLACKLVAGDHNRDYQDLLSCITETEKMEHDAEEFMATQSDESESSAGEEEDMTIEEWGQLGYNWFGRHDYVYM
jgi:hypothetical protein